MKGERSEGRGVARSRGRKRGRKRERERGGEGDRKERERGWEREIGGERDEERRDISLGVNQIRKGQIGEEVTEVEIAKIYISSTCIIIIMG